MLNKLLNKKKLVVIGINSGTSTDALDLAAVEIKRHRNTGNIRFLRGKEVKIPSPIKSALIQIADDPAPDLEEIIYINNILGEFIGQKAAGFIKSLHTKNISVDFIASHGQTIRHLPKKVIRFGKKVGGTLQIGSPDVIAAQCGLPVVGDFRQADIAVGNEGAPITTGAMHKLFASKKEPKLIVNIGGMSNYFYFPALSVKKKNEAKDCGPGNILSDLLSQKLFHSPYDKNGKRASNGTVSQRLLTLLLSDSFYSSAEKSTGRESFGKKTIEKMITFAGEFHLSNEDLLATAVECTARSIQRAVMPIFKKEKKLRKLYLTGGGRKNIFLRKRLQQLLPGISIGLIDELGIPGDFIEVVSYAVLGEAFLRSECIHTERGKNGLYPLPGKLHLPPVEKRKG